MVGMAMRRKTRAVLLSLLGLLLIAAGGSGWWFMHRAQALIPDYITKQLEFVLIYPGGQYREAVNTNSLKYDPTNKVLSFTITLRGSGLTVTEQATPSAFSDIPQYYDKLVQRMNGYKTLDTYNGKVDLTKPTSANGDQVAVFNNRGTLLFAHATHDISEDQWRRFFNDAVYLK